MFGAVVVYTVISYLVAGMPFIPVFNVPVETTRYIFMLIAVGALVLALLFEKDDVVWPVSQIFPARRSSAVLFRAIYVAVIVSLAISEAIAIFGLILLFLGEGLPIVYAFMAVSALSMFFFRPDRDELEQFVNRTKTGLTAIE